MVSLKGFIRLHKHLLPKTTSVPKAFYGIERMLDAMQQDYSLEQAAVLCRVRSKPVIEIAKMYLEKHPEAAVRVDAPKELDQHSFTQGYLAAIKWMGENLQKVKLLHEDLPTEVCQ